MRLQRGETVARIEPGVARSLARACLVDGTRTDYIAHVVKVDVAEAERLLRQLEADGYVRHETPESDGEPEVWWNTTLPGSGLAGASFLRPINRAKAESHLAGLLDRAASYNADVDKPVWIERISLFGSLLDDTATDFGDVDLHVVLEDRAEHDAAEAALAYARASGTTFPNWIDRFFWAKTEAKQILRNRSGYLSIHTEDLNDVTDRIRVVYDRKGV
ncbi:hypothetical protein ACFQHV_23690 [Promicromonospora thailandica]|uniref:Uncharacterized protein n=1 Tax=Promicromonospora thailandica TaxID=765201 RepID=A0A9X2JVS4_9MICO|nr:hypothetical protein [Promicromonospora thailandica]MCP2264408.1 hypothetical protein [Promicromonospora thailandica]BFF20895.1 hypothetical protein GCM10025730_44160 [Promicromonospora thailandica]